MATIVENIVGDKALQFSQPEEFARKLSFGNKWNALRIGVLWRVNDSVTIASRCRFQLGLCNGDTNTFASSTCSGYIGVVPGFLTSAITYTYDAPNTAYTTNAYWYGYTTKVGASVSDGLYAGFTGNQYFAASTSTGPRINGMTIYRNSATSYTLYYHYCTLAQFNFIAPRHFELQSFMEDESLSGWAANYISTATNPALTSLSTSLSSLDTVSIYWNKLNLLEISALAVSRFY
jgi:hypothetical protein